jgi:hypothetical protein
MNHSRQQSVCIKFCLNLAKQILKHDMFRTLEMMLYQKHRWFWRFRKGYIPDRWRTFIKSMYIVLVMELCITNLSPWAKTFNHQYNTDMLQHLSEGTTKTIPISVCFIMTMSPLTEPVHPMVHDQEQNAFSPPPLTHQILLPMTSSFFRRWNWKSS